MKILMLLIPFIGALFFRLGGVGRDGRFLPFMKPGCKLAGWIIDWRGIGIPLMIGILTCNWIYVVTYFVALNAFSYGETFWFRRLFGRTPCWLVYGALLGGASLSWINAIWGAVCFHSLMIQSNDGYKGKKLDHAYVELFTGFFLMLVFWFK